MRSIIFASLSLILGAATVFAHEDPPQQQPASVASAATTAVPSQAAPATPASTLAASTSPATSSQPAAPAAISTAAHPTQPQGLTDTNVPAANPDSAADEKLVLSLGYKRRVRDGQVTFCRTEVVLGSHFEKKVCGTAEQLASAQRLSKDLTAGSERNSNPLSLNDFDAEKRKMQ